MLTIFSRNGQNTLNASAIVLPRLTAYADVSSVMMREWPHLQGLKLADPEFCSLDTIDLLLGADVYVAIIESSIKRGGSHEPIVQWTSFRWIVSGAVNEMSSHMALH